MRRLTGAPAARLAEERGAVAVFVALGMTLLLAFAALAVTTSAVRRDQQVLRNAADAAALAVALDCSRAVGIDDDLHACPATVEEAATATARELVTANGVAAGDVTASTEGRTVTVTVRTAAARPLPVGPGTVSVTSRAEWTPATVSFASSYPLAISACQAADLPAQAPARLATEPGGLWLLPPRQELTPVDWRSNATCAPAGQETFLAPTSVMTPKDPGAECGSVSVLGEEVVGERFEEVAAAARTCVAGGRYGDPTSWPHGGHEIVLPVYDRADGDRYRVSGHLGFHVMGLLPDGGLWGFSTGPVTAASGTPVPPTVRLAVAP